MPKIDNWCVINNLSGSRVLVGNITGHERQSEFYPSIEQITTPIVGKRGDKVVTRSGTEYELGVESRYNNSINSPDNLLDSLTEV